MIFEKTAVLKGITGLQSQEDYPIAERFLRSRNLIPATTRIATPTVGIMRQVWKSRLWNSVRINKKFFGCAEFVAKLEEIREDAALVQFSFKNDLMTGTFWFGADSDEPIGFVIVEIDQSRPSKLSPEFTEPPSGDGHPPKSKLLEGLLNTEVTYKKN